MKITEEKLESLARKLLPHGDNYYAHKVSFHRQTYYKIGFTNDYPLQHGDGAYIMIPLIMIEYYLNEVPDNFKKAIQAKISTVKLNGDMGVENSAYWNMCGLHDSIEILTKII